MKVWNMQVAVRQCGAENNWNWTVIVCFDMTNCRRYGDAGVCRRFESTKILP